MPKAKKGAGAAEAPDPRAEHLEAIKAVERIREGKDDLMDRGFEPRILRVCPELYHRLEACRQAFDPAAKKLTELCGMEIVVDSGMDRYVNWYIEEEQRT